MTASTGATRPLREADPLRLPLPRLRRVLDPLRRPGRRRLGGEALRGRLRRLRGHRHGASPRLPDRARTGAGRLLRDYDGGGEAAGASVGPHAWEGGAAGGAGVRGELGQRGHETSDSSHLVSGRNRLERRRAEVRLPAAGCGPWRRAECFDRSRDGPEWLHAQSRRLTHPQAGRVPGSLPSLYSGRCRSNGIVTLDTVYASTDVPLLAICGVRWPQEKGVGVYLADRRISMDQPLPIRRFPLKEFKEELDSDHAEFEASVEASVQEVLGQLADQTPQLMDAKVEAINEIKISVVFGLVPPKGVLLEYLQQEQSRIYKELCSQLEETKGRLVSLDEVECTPTLALEEFDAIERLWNDYRANMAKEVSRSFLRFASDAIPETQTVRPGIQISLYLPDPRGAQILCYAEAEGKVLVDEIRRLPTVTLDTNVVREWWEDQDKIEHVRELLELGKSRRLDLAVTGRIADDIPNPPLANRINELPNLDVHNVGSVIRFGHWRVGIDVAGRDGFEGFLGSPAVVNKLNRMSARRRPDWRDWDHLRTHYRYNRDYFLTWDRGILEFAEELHETLGVLVREPETYLSSHLPVE